MNDWRYNMLRFSVIIYEKPKHTFGLFHKKEPLIYRNQSQFYYTEEEARARMALIKTISPELVYRIKEEKAAFYIDGEPLEYQLNSYKK